MIVTTHSGRQTAERLRTMKPIVKWNLGAYRFHLRSSD